MPTVPPMGRMPTQLEVDKKRAIAQALLKVQMPQGQMAGRFYAAPSPWAQALSGVANAFGQYQSGKADEMQKGVDAETKRKMAEALVAQSGGKLKAEELAGVPLDQQQALYSSVMKERLTAKPAEGFTLSPGQSRYDGQGKPLASAAAIQDPFTLSPGQSRFGPDGKPIAQVDPELVRVDRGGSIGMVNPLTANQVTAFSKSVSPEAQLSSDTTLAGQRNTAEIAAANRATTESNAQLAADTSKANAQLKSGAAGKLPVLNSLDYVADEMRGALKEVSTGGPGGIKGKLSSILDYQDKSRVNNLKEQFSTELRTLFRIPGEGALTDQEQKQYGLQLPSTDYDAETNEKIVQDLQNRARLRLGQPILQPQTPLQPDQSAAPAAVDFSGISDEELMKQINGG